MKQEKFPQTKDERFLLGIAERAHHQGNVLDWVDWKPVAQALNFGEKSAHNMVNILAKTYLVQKKEDKVRLTAVSFRHYGEYITDYLGIAFPNLDELED